MSRQKFAMNVVTGIKAGVSTAWLLLSTAALMLIFVTDRYRGGYEDMVSDAGLMFIAGLVVATIAVMAAMLVRRKSPKGLSRAWFAAGIIHVALSVAFLLGVYILVRVSS